MAIKDMLTKVEGWWRIDKKRLKLVYRLGRNIEDPDKSEISIYADFQAKV